MYFDTFAVDPIRDSDDFFLGNDGSVQGIFKSDEFRRCARQVM